MMEFQKVIVLQLIFLGLSTFKSSIGSIADYQPVLKCTCEPVIADICATEYNRTTFPNKVNRFSSERDALKEFASFPTEALSLQNCSSMLITFLCSYYFPPCLKDLNCEGVGPCDTLCEQVRAGCEPLLLKRNYTWPDHLNCSKFPTTKSADPYCIPATPPVVVVVEPSCEKVKQPICAALDSNYMTQFPNKDLITQNDADIQFNTFVPALSSNCSSMLKMLLCTSHYPICTDGSVQIYPCRHMCEQVQQSCEPFLLQQNVSWPKFLNCSNFPNKNDSVCVDRDSIFNAPSTPTPKAATLPPMPSQDTCEPILPEVLEICGGIHPNYTMTHFPYGHFTSQKEAIETLKNTTEYLTYLELLDQNCAAEIKPFLCLHFFPMCSPTQPITIVKPCRNVCRKATNGCSACVNKWSFDCDDYKVKGTCLNLDALKQYTRKFPKETKC